MEPSMDPSPATPNPPLAVGLETAETPHGSHAIAPPAGSQPEQTLLDQVVWSSARARGSDPSRAILDRFLNEPSPAQALSLWLGLSDPSVPQPTRSQITRRLSRDIARIDELLATQLDAILHHPAYQKLEASWRGLSYLVNKLPDNDSVKIRVLNITWAELVQDQSRALEFDQSQLFRKVYEAEFGHPGGEPFGILLGDYEIRHRPSAEHPFDDLEALSKISGVAAASFAPFVAGVHPTFFGLDSFTEIERPLDFSKIFEQMEYLKWRSFRQVEDARFVGLTLPRMLLRVPHKPVEPGSRTIHFREEVEGPDRSKYLWGNSVYAFGAVVMRCFLSSGWLADIRGVRQGMDDTGDQICLDDGGLVTGLPVHAFATDRRGMAIKCSTEVIITDSREKELDELGFIPLCHCHDTEFSAFYSNGSVQKPKQYDDLKATTNARLSAMLQYMLCVSRFAHYLKVISRDMVGSMASPEDCEHYLGQWLRSYTTASDTAGPDVKAKYPLREAKVAVRERPDKPGSYNCVIHLRPHFQLDQMFTTMKLTTELGPGKPD
jgi:type VI secretion system ImpC/EvpB family protein